MTEIHWPAGDYYDCRDTEDLCHQTPADALVEYVDVLGYPAEPVADLVRCYAPFVVTAYRRADDEWCEPCGEVALTAEQALVILREAEPSWFEDEAAEATAERRGMAKS